MKAWLLLAVLLIVVVVVVCAEIPWEPAAAHQYADAVLLPRFVAGFNDWTRLHPVDPPGHEWEHCAKLDAGDVARWKKVRKAFGELDRAYKRAGY